LRQKTTAALAENRKQETNRTSSFKPSKARIATMTLNF